MDAAKILMRGLLLSISGIVLLIMLKYLQLPQNIRWLFSFTIFTFLLFIIGWGTHSDDAYENACRNLIAFILIGIILILDELIGNNVKGFSILSWSHTTTTIMMMLCTISFLYIVNDMIVMRD